MNGSTRTSTRRTAVLVGLLFLIATATFITADSLIDGALTEVRVGELAAGTILVTLLYRSRLIPRWIAVLGLIGYPVMLVGTVLYMFDLIDLLQGAGTIAALPVGLFELALPLWLLARGFTGPADRVGRCEAIDA